MRNYGLKTTGFILRHPLAVVMLTLLVTLGALFCVSRIKLDNSVDVFFDKKSRGYTEFEKWKEQFGSDQVVIIAFSSDNIFSAENLSLIADLTSRFQSLKYADKVTSLTSVNTIIGTDNDFIVRPLVEEVPADPAALEAIRKEALGNPLYLKNIISRDGKTTALLVEMEKQPPDNNTYKKETIENIQKILREEAPRDIQFHVSGQTTIEYFYARYMQEDLKVFMPIIFAILILILILSLRSFWGVVLPLLVTVISLIWTMAFLYLCGYSVNNVTTVIPPIMLSITLLESIHLIWELMRENKPVNDVLPDPDALLSKTMQHLFTPCFLTNITTVVGFFALMVSRIPPIKQLGLVAGVGVFFAFIVTFSFLPAFIKQFGLMKHLRTKGAAAPGEQEVDPYGFVFLKKGLDNMMLAVVRFSDKYKGPILIGVLIITIISLWGTFKIKTETSVLEYFKKDSPVYRSTTFIEEHLSGIHLFNISLKTTAEDYFKDPRALAIVEKIQDYLNTIPEVDKTTSVVDYIKEINKSFHNEEPRFYNIPESQNLTAQYILLYGADDLEDFANAQWNWTTVQVRLKEHSTARLKNILAQVEKHIRKQILPREVTVDIVGQTVLEVDSNEAVTSGQVQSLALAMLVIFGMMFVDFRSFSVGILSIIPNLLPLLMGFGIMGLCGIRLDSATSMISDIGIGIIVDDTIHFFHSFGEALKETGNHRLSMDRTFALKGRPTIITSLILILGFGVVATSKFVPTYYFGLLSAVLILNGLVVELFVGPALLLWFKPKFKRVREA